jgi:hypothetical protein
MNNEVPKNLSDIIGENNKRREEAKLMLPDPRKELGEAKDLLGALINSGAFTLLKQLYLYVTSVPDLRGGIFENTLYVENRETLLLASRDKNFTSDLSWGGIHFENINYIEGTEVLFLNTKNNGMVFTARERVHPHDNLNPHPPSIVSRFTYNHNFVSGSMNSYSISWDDYLEASCNNKNMIYLARCKQDKEHFTDNVRRDFQSIEVPQNDKQKIDKVLGEFYQKQPALPFQKLLERNY